MVRTKVSTPEETEEKETSVYDVMKLLDATSNIEKIVNKFQLSNMILDKEVRRSTVISSGLLMTDIMLNGGMYPGGWYTFFGAEGSAKSTHQMSVMVSLLDSNVPIIECYDPEGSTSIDYIEKIAGNLRPRSPNVVDIFGLRDTSGDNWIKEPRIWYFPEKSLEKCWNSMASMLRKLPDKRYIKGEWWLFYPRTKPNISRLKGMTNAKLSKKHEMLVVPSLDGGTAQALFLIDSYPMMFPDALDTDDPNKSMALQARQHALLAPGVRSAIESKHCVVIGTNQLRLKPGPAFGNPEYEPCGNTLKHCAVVRMKQVALSVPHAKGPREEENSVEYKKGVDTYRYVRMQAIKNKYGTPHIEAWYRIWESDANGEGRGLCPVYDTWQYLESTGQVSGTIHRKISINIEDEEGGLELNKIGWWDFKRLILFKGKKLQKIGTKLGLKENPNIRERCFQQIREGYGIEWYFKNLRGWDD